MANYFQKEEWLKLLIKIQWFFVAILLVINILIARSLISIASNKNVNIQVPQFMESGDYTIGATEASENVFNMWARVWVEGIGSFSYNNIDQRIETFLPFIDSQTMYKNKSELIKFADFVKTNFITQKFSIQDIKTERISKSHYKVTAFGTINRQIGKSEDQLNGMRYAYTFVCYVRNGQIYIQSISSSFFGLTDTTDQRKLKLNKFVHFDEVLQ